MDEARPLEMLAGWLRDAREAGLEEHDAVALATVDTRGRPSARTVSLRRVEDAGLIFTTALWTRKARDLESNPHVAMLCHWPTLGRQAQVCGRAERAGRHLTETLFAQRDRPHQLQSLVSRQGEPISNLDALRERLAAAEAEIGDDPIPCPADWGAFRIRPDVIEYWTAAPDAMHDRIVLVRDGRRWRVTRLAP